MHFLKDLISHNNEDDPVKSVPHVHRHFVRYSKGQFEGPAMKIKFAKTNINIYAGFEYEDLLYYIIAESMNDADISEEFSVTGNIISSRDISKVFEENGIPWKMKKSTGKTKNFKCPLKPAADAKLNKDKMKSLIVTLNSSLTSTYTLLNFKIEGYSIKTAKNPPRPKQSGSTAEDQEKSKAARIKFCTAKLPNTEKNRKMLIEEVVPEFKDEITAKCKQIEIYNNYLVEELILPPKEKVKS
ncbi:MAG: hypothetical protein GY870_22565, partial [archaeon]|nr:hypothetical protein [archaeon]